MNHGTDKQRVYERHRADAEAQPDELAELLSDPHCRYLLEYLRKHEDPASLASVTRYVVAEITDTSPDDVSEDVQRRVQTWMHHGQLPTLDKYGVVDFDAESGTVSLADDQSD